MSGASLQAAATVGRFHVSGTFTNRDGLHLQSREPHFGVELHRVSGTFANPTDPHTASGTFANPTDPHTASGAVLLLHDLQLARVPNVGRAFASPIALGLRTLTFPSLGLRTLTFLSLSLLLQPLVAGALLILAVAPLLLQPLVAVALRLFPPHWSLERDRKSVVPRLLFACETS
jgi:hypothetical protein